MLGLMRLPEQTSTVKCCLRVQKIEQDMANIIVWMSARYYTVYIFCMFIRLLDAYGHAHLDLMESQLHHTCILCALGCVAVWQDISWLKMDLCP